MLFTKHSHKLFSITKIELKLQATLTRASQFEPVGVVVYMVLMQVI